MEKLYAEFLSQTSYRILKPGGMKYLSDKYIPENPLYRREHILRLSKWIHDSIETGSSGTIFLEGPPGTGKTMCFKISEKFTKKKLEEENFQDFRIVYINGRNKTLMNVLTEVLNSIGYRTPPRGLSYGEVISKLQNAAENMLIHVCIDEIDQLRIYHLSYTLEDLLYLFSRTNGLSLTTITNNYQFLSELEDSRVASSITKEKNLIFERYNKKQCFDILKDRCDRAFKEGVMSDEILENLADYVSDISGDIRDGLDILRNCVEICEEEKREKIDVDVLKKAVDIFRNRKMIQKIQALSLSQKTVLAAYYANIVANNEKEQTTEQLFETYHALREKIGKSATIQDLRARIADLVTFSIFESIKSGRGPRKGIERRYRATVPLEIIYRAVITDPDISAQFKKLIEEIREKKIATLREHGFFE